MGEIANNISDLVEQIRSKCTGRDEWQVMNADETGICMWFTRDDHVRPAQAAQRWLDEHPSKKEQGYHVVERHLFSELEALALAADGTLVFKWNETQVKLAEVLPLAPAKPLFGQISGRSGMTHWLVFMKPSTDHPEGGNGEKEK